MVLVLGMSDAKNLLSMKDTLELVEVAFKEKGLNRVQLPPKSYLFFKQYNGDLRMMPSYLEAREECGVKIVNSHPDNPGKYGLPSVIAVLMLYDVRTGKPVAIMDGTWITAMRTGAAAGVAAKYLARKDSRIVGVVGAGFQARFQLEALNEVLSIGSVKVYDRLKDKALELADTMNLKISGGVTAVDRVKDAVKDVDVLVTATPAREPVVKNQWITAGMHIISIGADAPGKEELDPEILIRAKIVVDDWTQASHSGEINVPLSKGMIKRDHVHGEFGEVVAGIKRGRVSNDEITIFDSTGLSIQDVITGWQVYRQAVQMGVGRDIGDFFLEGT